MERKYNYVLFGVNSGLMGYSYSDLNEDSGAYRIPETLRVSKFLYPFFKLHYSRKVNNICNIPLKNIWNSFFYGHVFKEEKPLCFIFSGGWATIAIHTGLLEYYRKNYPGSKMVWFMQDLFSRQKMYFTGDDINIQLIKDKYDLILSFDNTDCDKYGLLYHPLVFSSFHGEKREMSKSDVYFLGYAKNRYHEIIVTFEALKKLGLILDFYLAGVNEEDRLYPEEIHYIDNMSYEDNLQHVLHSKCLLEIMQHGGTGYTQRSVEAVCLDKLLLTNNTNIINAPFYNDQYISVFKEPDNINPVFLEKVHSINDIDYHYKEKLSPIELLDFIDVRL